LPCAHPQKPTPPCDTRARPAQSLRSPVYRARQPHRGRIEAAGALSCHMAQKKKTFGFDARGGAGRGGHDGDPMELPVHGIDDARRRGGARKILWRGNGLDLRGRGIQGRARQLLGSRKWARSRCGNKTFYQIGATTRDLRGWFAYVAIKDLFEPRWRAQPPRGGEVQPRAMGTCGGRPDRDRPRQCRPIRSVDDAGRADLGSGGVPGGR